MAGRTESDAERLLTPREREVLELLRLGITNGEIAERLGISVAGARYHVSEIIGKLGVRSRYEAASWPEPMPWWARALAPLALFWRRAGRAIPFNLSAAALVASIALFATALGGIGLIAFLLLRSDGDERPDNVWLDLLSQVPAVESENFVVMHDYERLRGLLDVDQPEPDLDDETLDAYIESVAIRDIRDAGNEALRLRSETIGFLPLLFVELRNALGFSIADLDQDVHELKEAGLHVLRGRFDKDAIDSAIRNDPQYGEHVQQRSFRGVNYYAWSGGPEDDFFMRGDFALALQGHTLYWVQPGVLERAIDTERGNWRSLADVPRYRDLLQALNQIDTYTALITDRTVPVSEAAELRAGLGASQALINEIEEEFREDTLLLPYQAIATGAGADEDGPYLALALHHADEAAARENVDRLQARIDGAAATFAGERWGDIVTVTEISSEGPVLLVKLRDDSMLWFNLAFETTTTLLLYDDEAQQ